MERWRIDAAIAMIRRLSPQERREGLRALLAAMPAEWLVEIVALLPVVQGVDHQPASTPGPPGTGGGFLSVRLP